MAEELTALDQHRMLHTGTTPFRALVRMNLRDRFLGSTLGPVWAVLNPLLMMGIYTFVFGFVFVTKIPGATTSLDYVVWLISGYAPWMATQEAIIGATGSVAASRGLIKNVAIRIEFLPMASGLMGLFPLAIGIAFVLVLQLVTGKGVPWTVLLLPIIVPLHFLLVIGIGLALSAVNVLFRDVLLALPNLLMVALFATPIFYPVEAVPERARFLAYGNPFYLVASLYRSILVDGTVPDAGRLLGLAVMAAGTFWAARRYFRRMERYFDSLL
ncbi:MAG: ABC transporter permease [Gammaproteobacteria bacterium]